MTKVIPFFFLCMAAVISTQPLTAGAAPSDPNAYKRVAVIGGAGLRAGLTDLIFNELQADGIELVEREQIAAVTREQLIASTFGAEGISGRIQIGKLIKADALVLVSEAGTGKDARIFVVVADCSRGARLSRTSYADGPAAELSHAIASDVVHTRRQFSGGLKGIVAVPPFISKDFTYENHALQAGYANLLQDALGKTPGIAVLEVEEAQAIRKELETSGGQVGGVVPIVVEGEYKTSAADGKSPLVDFKISLVTSGKARLVERKGLTLEGAAQFIARDLPAEVLPAYRENLQKPFTPQAEFATLVARADDFDKLGEWRHAIDLREAALVISPQSAEQRQRVIYDGLSMTRSLMSYPYSPKPDPAREERAASGFVCWRAMLDCAEWQLHHQTPADVARSSTYGAVSGLMVLHNSRIGGEVQRLKRDFLQRVYPLTWDPTWVTAPPRFDPRFTWVDELMYGATWSVDKATKDDFDLLLYLLNEVVPDNIEPNQRLMGFLLGRQPAVASELVDFLHAMKESKRPLNRILARVSMLERKIDVENQTNEQMLAQCKELEDEYRALHLATEPFQRFGVISEIERIRNSLKPPPVFTSRRPVPKPGETQPSIEPDRPRIVIPPPAGEIEAGVMKLTRIPIARVGLDGKPLHPGPNQPRFFEGFDHVIRINDSLDATWDVRSIYWMHQPGLLETCFRKEGTEDFFSDVQWDGEHLWAATFREGLWLINPAGTVEAKLGEAEGLPPMDQGVRLQVLERNRLIVVGCFGPTHRTFIALLTKAAGAWHSQVFHRATRVTDIGVVNDPNDDPDLAFKPTSLARCRTPDGGDFLVLRREFSTEGALAHPLIVDLKTFKVSACKTSIHRSRFLPVADGIFDRGENEDYRLWHITADGLSVSSDYPPLRLPRNASAPRRRNSETWAVGSDGMIYIGGASWFRIDPKTMTAQRLALEGPTRQYDANAALTHAGLVVWGLITPGETSIYTLSLDEGAINALAESEQFAPEPAPAPK